MVHIQRAGEAIKNFETVAGANVNRDNSVGLQLCTRRGKTILLNNVVERWTERPVKLLAVQFGPYFHREKNWSAVTSRVTHLHLTYPEQRLTLKGRAEVTGMFITFVIAYRLTVMHCPFFRC